VIGFEFVEWECDAPGELSGASAFIGGAGWEGARLAGESQRSKETEKQRIQFRMDRVRRMASRGLLGFLCFFDPLLLCDKKRAAWQFGKYRK